MDRIKKAVDPQLNSLNVEKEIRAKLLDKKKVAFTNHQLRLTTWVNTEQSKAVQAWLTVCSCSINGVVHFSFSDPKRVC